jgi:hypothetical protein
VRLVQDPSRQYEPLSCCCDACDSLDSPLRGLFVPRTAIDPCIERYVFPQTQRLVDMREVLLQFAMIWKTLREAPSIVNFRDVELVEGRFAIYTCTGIAVPVPYAAEVRSWDMVSEES